MWKSIRRWWHYLGTKLGMTLEENADPKVQLEQAIADAREQHRLLTEQAAMVIANQKQIQLRLDRALDAYQAANASARQALTLADREARAERAEKAASFTQAAEGYAGRIVALEHEIEDLKAAMLPATDASARAREAVKQNSLILQKKLAEREALLSKLDQARMQEQMNSAMTQLHQTVGEDVPTLDEVRAKIDKRLAMAQATTEVTGAGVSSHMLAVEQAQQEAETDARLAALRSEMGLDLAMHAVPPASAAASAPNEGAGT